MSLQPPTVPRPTGLSSAVSAIGLLTLLWGAVHAIAGGYVAVMGATAAQGLQDDPAGGLGFLLQALFGFVAVVGVAWLLQGALALLAGWGVLSRQGWARILTLILAGLAILWGLLSLSFYAEGISYIAVGAAEILYGLLAILILGKEAGEFAAPRVGRRMP